MPLKARSKNHKPLIRIIQQKLCKCQDKIQENIKNQHKSKNIKWKLIFFIQFTIIF